MNNLTDVVKNLIIINVLAFLGTMLLPEQYKAMGVLYYFESSYFRPYQIVTSMFLHADIMHLVFNMFTLFFIGPMVERALGAKKFLLLYLASGLGASALHFGWSYYGLTQGIPPGAVLGASGCTSGVVLAFAAMFPNMKMMIFPIPIPIAAKYLAVLFIVGSLYLGVGGRFAQGIAHFAHLGGAIIGFLMIKYWKMSNLR